MWSLRFLFYIRSTNQFHNAAFLTIYRIPSPLSSQFTPFYKTNSCMSKGGENIGLERRKFSMSEQCQFEVCSNHPLYYCITLSPCFYTIPIFTINFYLLVSFPFLRHSHAWHATERGYLGHNAHNKSNISYRLRRFVAILCFLCISAPSFIVRGPTIRH